MAAYLELDDVDILREKVDRKAHDLFKARPGVAQLQVSRYGSLRTEDGKEESYSLRNQELKNLSDVRTAQQDPSANSEIFFIRQDRSWTTLNISHDLLQGLMRTYEVFPQFWKCVFTFGRKDHENEFEFPEFRARHSLSERENETYESAYVLRRVEIHGRELAEGQSPWSIRQTAVYHRFTVNPSPVLKPKSTFLMIAPSPTVEKQLERCFELGSQASQTISIWNVHRLLVADSMQNWMDYIAHLEERLRDQSDPIVLANIGTRKENLAPLTDFYINFADRQELKILEDEALDLQVILSTMLKTITRIRGHCKKSCQNIKMTKSEKRHHNIIMEEFDEYIRDAETCLERCKILQRKASSTTQLLSDLLSYEEAVALKDLTKETQLENKSMYYLTERSTKDAAAVKILTVITLIYLPTTIVANFFSTQFVETNDAGHMRLSNNAWLLAAIAIPLTLFTIALWATWVYFTKVTPPTADELPGTHPAILRRRQSSFKSLLSSRRYQRQSPKNQHANRWRSIFSSKKTSQQRDLEKGIADAVKIPPGTPPPPSVREAGSTWSSTATTVKVG